MAYYPKRSGSPCSLAWTCPATFCGAAMTSRDIAVTKAKLTLEWLTRCYERTMSAESGTSEAEKEEARYRMQIAECDLDLAILEAKGNATQSE
jgi:hypothetical protein